MTTTVHQRRESRATGSPTGQGFLAKRQSWVGYAFLSPALVLFIVFIAGPFVAAIGLSLYQWDMLTTPEFVGLRNFEQMMHDPVMFKALRNTFFFTFASVVTHVVGGFVLALGVNRVANRALSYFVRTAIFFPFVISWAAVALLWKYVLDPTFGIGTYYLNQLGFSPPNWFVDPNWALPAIIGIDLWHTLGFAFVIMLAGLQTVPPTLVEAARCEGAGPLRILWHVTIPLMSPTIFFVTVMAFIGAFQIFDPVQIITPNGGPNNSTVTLVMYLYQKGFESFEVGYASAISLVVFVVIMIVTMIQFWGARRWVHYG